MMSLVDSVDAYVIDVWLAFYDIAEDRRRSRLWRWLQPGFSHVEAWRYDRGAWARVDPCLEFMVAEVHLQPPWETGLLPSAKFVHVQRLAPRGRVREPFLIGPITCVELSKALIGIRAPLVRTPYALYKHLRKTECSPSSSVLLRVSSWLWSARRFFGSLRRRLLNFAPFAGKEHEDAQGSEGRSGDESPARAADYGSGATGRTAEHPHQADVERFPRHPYVHGITTFSRRA